MFEKILQCSQDFSEVARRYNHIIEIRAGIDIPGPEPRITFSTSDRGKHIMAVAIFCPTAEAWNLEQKLSRDFLGFPHTTGLAKTSRRKFPGLTFSLRTPYF